MTVVEGILVAFSIFNTLICGFLAYRLTTVKTALKELQIIYFTETRSKDGFIKKESIIQIKGQLLVGGIPVGPAFLISEQASEQVDKEQINRILEEFARPLISLGLKVMTKKLL